MKPIVLNQMTVFPDRRRVEVGGKRVDGIGYPGWDFLYTLARMPGKLVSRDMLFVSVYPDPEARPSSTRVIDVIACKVRKRLAENANGHNFIQSVHNGGYALVTPE